MRGVDWTQRSLYWFCYLIISISWGKCPGDFYNCDNPGYVLFATLGGSECSESLSYGDQRLLFNGTADGEKEYYFSTFDLSKHDEWLQITTKEETNVEYFRIQYKFSSNMTIVDRVLNASNHGVYTNFTITNTSTGSKFNTNGTFWFTDRLSATYESFNSNGSKCCLADDDGVFGAGGFAINGNQGDGVFINNNFWGTGNTNAFESECDDLWMNGVERRDFGAKSYIYIVLNSSSSPSFAEGNDGNNNKNRIDAIIGIAVAIFVVIIASCSFLYYKYFYRSADTGRAIVDQRLDGATNLTAVVPRPRSVTDQPHHLITNREPEMFI